MKTKTMLLLAGLLWSFGGLTAQVTSQGNFIIGGTLGFSASSSSVDVSGTNVDVDNQSTKTSQFNISPSIGYFLVENFALGIGLDYTFNRTEQPAEFGDESEETEFDSDLLFGPFARYYFPVGIDKAFFLEATFGFGRAVDELETPAGDQTASTSVYAFGVGPGFTIFSSDAIGIEALVKYNWGRSNTDISFQGIDTEATSTTNQIDFSVGLQFYFSRIQPAETSQPGGNF